MKIYLIICWAGLSLWSCFGAELLPAGAGENPIRESLSPSVEMDRVQALKSEISKQTEVLESLQASYYELLNWLRSWFPWRGEERTVSTEKTETEKEDLQRQITTTQETLVKLKEELDQVNLGLSKEEAYSLEEYKRQAVLNCSFVHSDFQETYVAFVEAACGFLAKRFGTEKERVLAAKAVLGQDSGIQFFNRFISFSYIKNEPDQDRKILLLMDFFMAKVQKLFGIMRPRVWESKF